MVSVAVVNGAFGEYLVAKITGPYGAHLYKTLVIILVIFLVSFWHFRRLARRYTGTDLGKAATATGLVWLSSSIIFEFVAGHFVFGFSWERLFGDYRIWEGRLWALVLASEIIAPRVGARLAKGAT